MPDDSARPSPPRTTPANDSPVDTPPPLPAPTTGETAATDAPAETGADLLSGRGPLVTQIRAARLAVTLLTRLPLGGFPYSPRELRWSSAYLPLVGALIGGALGGVMMLCAPAGGFVAASVVLCVSLWLTGALHEDGLADTADALGGASSREKVFAILKDSRIGAFGAAALGATMLLRVAALAQLGVDAPAALVLTGAVSRASPCVLLAALPYVTAAETSKSRGVATAGWTQACLALVLALALAMAIAVSGVLPLPAVAGAVTAAAAMTWMLGLRFFARVGGVTGDFLGAAQQLSECAILLALVVIRGAG